MGRYCDGDSQAFRNLYALVAGELGGYLRRLTGEAALADDLLQTTFLKIHRARGAYVRQADPLPWFYAIAHRTFLDEMRRKKRSRVTSTEDVAELPEEAATAPAQASDTPASARELQSALDKLPAKQKEAVLLTKMGGKSMAEAAVIAGTTQGAMKVRAHRGTQALRRLLGGERRKSA